MRLIPQSIREEQISEICKGTSYSFVGWVGQYKGNRTPIVMKCEIHGEWQMYLPDLFRGVRCAACKNVRNLTENEVLERIHNACQSKNFEFVRWNTEYKNMRSRAIFKCHEHGEWSTQCYAVTNLSSGCPLCSKNGFNIKKPGYLYCLKSNEYDLVKIGITNDLRRRCVELKRITPFKFEILSSVYNKSGAVILALENSFHRSFESANLEGFNGATEWLKWNPEIPLWLEYLNG